MGRAPMMCAVIASWATHRKLCKLESAVRRRQHDIADPGSLLSTTFSVEFSHNHLHGSTLTQGRFTGTASFDGTYTVNCVPFSFVDLSKEGWS